MFDQTSLLCVTYDDFRTRRPEELVLPPFVEPKIFEAFLMNQIHQLTVPKTVPTLGINQ